MCWNSDSNVSSAHQANYRDWLLFQSVPHTKQAETALSALYLDIFCLLAVFETASHYVALANLELLTILPLSPYCRD